MEGWIGEYEGTLEITSHSKQPRWLTLECASDLTAVLIDHNQVVLPCSDTKQSGTNST